MAAAFKRRGGERVRKRLGRRPGQIWIVELNESEPWMTCRKRMDDVKTGVVILLRDKLGGDLLSARAASVRLSGLSPTPTRGHRAYASLLPLFQRGGLAQAGK